MNARDIQIILNFISFISNDAVSFVMNMFRFDFFALSEFYRHCLLSGGIQRRALSTVSRL